MNERQKKFVDYYIQNFGNATLAARQAGYSVKTARSIGNRLLTFVDVKNAIDEKLKELENQRTANSQEVLEYLTSVLRGEVEEEVVVVVGTGHGRSEAIKINKAPSTKDRLKAAEILCRIFGLFNAEKVEVNAGEILITTLNSVWIDENVG